MIYEFVGHDTSSLLRNVETELRSRQVGFRRVQIDWPNQWFQLEMDGMAWGDVKMMNVVQAGLRNWKLRLVRPVENWNGYAS